MTQLDILPPNERRQFDSPPTFKKEERTLYFHLSKDTRLSIVGISNPSNKVGFLLQLGYFRASARFFKPSAFKKRDIDYVCRLLGVKSPSFDHYEGTVITRHRRRILDLSNWREFDDAARDILGAHARRHAENQLKPRKILTALLDYCWQSQIRIPSYHELNSIIAESFNSNERKLLATLKSSLDLKARRKLDAMLFSKDNASSRSKHPITSLKTISQSLKAGEISRSVAYTELFRDYFRDFSTCIEGISLSDQATEYYTTWLHKANAQQLSQFSDRNKAYLHLLAFIKHQFYKRQDTLVDILLKSVTAAIHAAKKHVADIDQATKAERNNAIQALSKSHKTATQMLKEVSSIVKAPYATPSEKYYKIEELIQDYEECLDEKNDHLIRELEERVDREGLNRAYYDALAAQSRKLQNRVGSIVRLLDFEASPNSERLMDALLNYKNSDGNVGQNPPVAFLSQQEFLAVFHENIFRVSLYKSLLFIYLAKAIKAGEINLRHSYKYRAIQDYLIDPDTWRKDRDRLLAESGLTKFANGDDYLAQMKQVLKEKYEHVNRRLINGENGYLSIDINGRVSVKTPRAECGDKEFIAATLTRRGYIPILQLLQETDRVADFTSQFKHFSVKNVKMNPSQEVFFAGLIGKGCNIGVRKIANISRGISEHVLHNVVNWYFTLENIRQANQKIIDTINKLALANNYISDPDVLHSSSDGRKVSVAVDSLLSNYSFKYLGKDKGVSLYTFIDERQTLFYSTVISASDREAAFVIDGLMQNDVPEQRIHSTDTHGYTETIFAATHLIGTAFAPRFRKVGHQTIYDFSTKMTHRKQGHQIVPSRTINKKLILDNWEDILRFMATIKLNHSSASQLFKRLSSYAHDHPLYRALKEFGRITKTQYILTYYDDVKLRQQVQKQLNRVELSNKFSHAVFFDNDQSFQVGTREEQEIATACKVLLQNAIVLWNYLYLSKTIIDAKDDEERMELIASIAQGSVITWRHVNLRGEYDFRKKVANDTGFDFDKIKSLKIQ